MFDEEVIKYFLENQGQLFDEPVAESIEEAEEFLDDCMAQLFADVEELKDYLDAEGTDTEGMTDEELLDQSEAFVLPDGRILFVEA